jgi:chorismate synthase
MRGNSFGKLFSFTSFGESHGPAMGVVIDGVPAGLHFDIRGLKNDLKRRAPGQSDITTSRKEDDEPIILSGIYGNKTLGTPIAIMVENKNAKSADYEAWKHEYRPGHADKTTELKYGIRDHRGGGDLQDVKLFVV